MNTDDRDETLRELFRAAREADGSEAPSFASVRDHEPAQAPPRRTRWLTLPAMATATTVCVAAIAGLLALRAPVPLPPLTTEIPQSAAPALHAPPPPVPIEPTQPESTPVVPPTEPLVPVLAKDEDKEEETGGGSPQPAKSVDLGSAAVSDATADVPSGDVVGSVPGVVVGGVVRVMAEKAVVDGVLTFAPGALDAEAPGRPNVHGSRERDFSARMGGIRQGASPVNPNAIEEMEIVAGGAPGEFGQIPGFTAATESYAPIQDNEFLAVREHPLSTLAIDVDTASYANVRRILGTGSLPPRDAVRIEELINYFGYSYPEPRGNDPVAFALDVHDCPWNAEHRLVRVGLKARRSQRESSGGSNLVFLIDVSGSMAPPNKLPLLKQALGLLVDQLDGRDRVAIVVYAGASGLALSPTPGSARGEIRAALDRLESGGGTNGGEGLRLAYQLARANFVPGGINRVILATDGDFNLGVTSKAELLDIIAMDAKAGVFLTALGFGMGNYKDDTLELLANRSNGNYAYIDDLDEARRVLVDQIDGTLVTVAKDVKLQVEFNPLLVGSYRLLGYESRLMRADEFRDDAKDGGEMGAGHSVTALYEIASPGGGPALVEAPPLRYQDVSVATAAARDGELLTVRMRYKEPEGATSRELAVPLVDPGPFAESPDADFQLAAAAAGFGMLLRDSPHRGTLSWDSVEELARAAARRDPTGERTKFAVLVARAAWLASRAGSPDAPPAPD